MRTWRNYQTAMRLKFLEAEEHEGQDDAEGQKHKRAVEQRTREREAERTAEEPNTNA